MSPGKWGKPGWLFLHAVALAYPENPTDEDKHHYYIFFNSLRYTLPCTKCKVNFADHEKRYPLNDEVLSSRDNLVKWTIDMHNIVNYYTGKKMLSYQEALDTINDNLEQFGKPKTNHDWLYVLLIIIVILVICYLLLVAYFKKRK